MNAGKWTACVLVVLATAALQAQTAETPPASRDQIIGEMVTVAVTAAQRGVIHPFRTPFGSGGEGEIAAYLIAAHGEREGYRALLQALEARTGKQLGSTPGGSGSTSLAMKGLVPKILGVAVESGAINREVSGTTLTFRATPSGVVKALQGKGLVDMYRDYSKNTAARMVSRLSAAASFDTSNGSTPGTFTADGRQLTGWSVRAEIINHRDPAAADYTELWKGLQRNTTKYNAAADAINTALVSWPAFHEWQARLETEVDARVEAQFATDHNLTTAGQRLRALLESELPRLEKLPVMPADVIRALDAYVAELTLVQTAIDRVYDFVGKGALVTFDWSAARSASLPDLYTATGVWEMALGASRLTDLTVNAALSVYRTVPAGAAQQFKSLDVTAQLDHPLGGVLSQAAVVFTLSGRYSHLPNDTVASADAVGPAAAAEHGNIGVVQAKLTIPVKGSGVKIPLSITASNRTELIKEKDVRASFGVTFDLDPLIGGLFPGKP
jgi:hypothetical protein